MFKETFSSFWKVVPIFLILADIVLSVPQGYFYANRQRNYYAQRAAQAQVQAQRIQAQRIAAYNRYQQAYRITTTTRRPYINRISKADAENAKFLGSQNQESFESGKTFKKKAKKLYGWPGYGPGIGNGCHFRNANTPKSEGRVFWDLNVYNVYPNGGCGGGFGGGFGGPGGIGGGLADPFYGGRPGGGLFPNLLGLFLPGGALSGVNRPYQAPPLSQSQTSASQTDFVDYDANLGGTGSGADSSTPTDGGGSNGGAGAGGNVNFGPNSSGMANLTPGQLVGGVAHTVNNVIQTLANAPVYG